MVATNVLHATPTMRNTLYYSKLLLRDGGLLIANEAVFTAAVAQITFGLTDGWWLFGESLDPERRGQGSPLLSSRQWESLISDSGFARCHMVQGSADFLRAQAVLVAQVALQCDDAAEGCSTRSTYIVSRGTGSLGLLAARLLLRTKGTSVLLLSESDYESHEDHGSSWLLGGLGELQRTRCDAAETTALRSVLDSKSQGIGGVFITGSSLLEGADITRDTTASLCWAFGRAVSVVHVLHAALWCAPLAFFSIFASTAGTTGYSGQAAHSASSAWLSTAGLHRRGLGLCGQGLTWSEMQVPAGFTGQQIDTHRLAASLRQVAFGDTGRLPLCRGNRYQDFAVLLPDTSQSSTDLTAEARPHSSVAEPMAFPCALANGSALGLTLGSLPPAERSKYVQAIVLQVVGEVAGSSTNKVDVEMPLADAGVDSLASTELASRLQSLTGVQLSPTVIFEHPSILAIAEFLQAEALGLDPDLPLVDAAELSAAEAAAIPGMGLQLPGMVLSEAAAATVAASGGDLVGTVPLCRWEISRASAQAANLSDSVLQQSSYGAFISCIELFDSRHFRIAPAEAAVMDPGQRLLLERGYLAAHRSGALGDMRGGSLTGVYLGMTGRVDFPSMSQAAQQKAGALSSLR